MNAQAEGIWNALTLKGKLYVLEEHTTVLAGLLAENETLIEMLRRNEPVESCLEFVNANW